MTPPALSTIVPAGLWIVDPSRSHVGFTATHVGASRVRGEFRDFEGILEIDERLPAKVSGAVRLASVTTGMKLRDDHLLSRDFFDAERHPDLSFDSSRLEPVDGRSFRVVGNLILHGVTRPVVLRAGRRERAHSDEHDRLGLKLTGTLSRGDYDLRFKRALRSGNALVADEVRLVLVVSLIKQPRVNGRRPRERVRALSHASQPSAALAA